VWSGRTDHRPSAALEAVYTYDDNHGGKVKQMRLSNNLQTVDYSYTIRDWLSAINDVSNMGSDKFAMALGYGNETSCGIQSGVPERWNGNIRWLMWNSSNGNGLDGYAFTYDQANRLTEARFKDFQGPCTCGWFSNQPARYSNNSRPRRQRL
jgi:hypothetical protein